MKYYKLTNQKGQTYGGTQWGNNVTHKVGGKGKELCTGDVIHCYQDPYLAVFANPIHANFNKPQLWEGKAEKVVADDGLKTGCKEFTTIKKIRLPKITTEQRVEIAIRCAMKVYGDEKFQDWAMKWITNKDRSEAAAWAAARAAAEAAAWAAARAAAMAAGAAAEAAARAAEAAAEAAFNLIDIIHEVVKGVKANV